MKETWQLVSGLFNSWIIAAVVAVGAVWVTWWGAAPPMLHKALIAAVALLLINSTLGAYLARQNGDYLAAKEERLFRKLLIYPLALLFAGVIGYCFDAGYGPPLLVATLVAVREGKGCLGKFAALGINLEELGKWFKLDKTDDDDV